MTRRIEFPNLEYKDGNPRYRVTWTEGGKRRERTIALDWKGDLQELTRLYWLCRNGQHPRQKAPAPAHSWKALITAWRSDAALQKNLSASTKVSYRRTMDATLEKNADKDVKDTTRAHLKAIHNGLAETPRKADHRIQVISLLWNYALGELEWDIGNNPAAQFKLFGNTGEFMPWPLWMIDALPTAPRDVQVASELLLGTGQRPNAAFSMRHDDFNGEEMWVTDEKSDKRSKVFCPDRLREFVASLKKEGAHLLPKNLTQPKGYDAMEKQFRKWRSGLGKEALNYSLHGLRKLAIIQLAEAGCPDAEIQAITGQSAAMVAFYREHADRFRLSKAGQNRRDRNKNRT